MSDTDIRGFFENLEKERPLFVRTEEREVDGETKVVIVIKNQLGTISDIVADKLDVFAKTIPTHTDVFPYLHYIYRCYKEQTDVNGRYSQSSNICKNAYNENMFYSVGLIKRLSYTNRRKLRILINSTGPEDLKNGLSVRVIASIIGYDVSSVREWLGILCERGYMYKKIKKNKNDNPYTYETNHDGSVNRIQEFYRSSEFYHMKKHMYLYLRKMIRAGSNDENEYWDT